MPKVAERMEGTVTISTAEYRALIVAEYERNKLEVELAKYRVRPIMADAIDEGGGDGYGDEWD